MYWGNRPESAEECARRALRLFAGLSRCDALFTTWYGLGRARKDALAHRLDVSDTSSLKELLERGRNRRDADRTVIEELGFGLGAWNGGVGGAESSLHLSCGSYASTPAAWIPNSCVLDLPSDAPASERLLTVAALLRIIEVMAAAWDPDWGVVMSTAFQQMVPSGEVGAPVVGWLTYLGLPPQSLPALPVGVRVAALSEGGSTIIATEERFTVTEPRHLQAAAAITNALSTSGLLRRIA
jgi:hypothetical protein